MACVEGGLKMVMAKGDAREVGHTISDRHST